MSNPPPGLAPPAPKAIPGARPRPIAGAAGAAASPGRSPGSLSTSFRRRGVAAENGTPDDANWRARSVDKHQEKRAGPERTVGGFEKSEVRAQPAGASALSTSKGKNSGAYCLAATFIATIASRRGERGVHGARADVAPRDMTRHGLR
jgi:hypothetical protein